MLQLLKRLLGIAFPAQQSYFTRHSDKQLLLLPSQKYSAGWHANRPEMSEGFWHARLKSKASLLPSQTLVARALQTEERSMSHSKLTVGAHVAVIESDRKNDGYKSTAEEKNQLEV